MKPRCIFKGLTRFAFCESGMASVEVGFIAIVIVTTLLGALEFSAVLSQSNKMSSAARAAVERAIVDPADISGITSVAVRSGNLDPGTLNVTVNQFCECPEFGPVPCTDTCMGGETNNSFVTVNLSQPAESYIQEQGFLNGLTLNSSATLRLR